MSDESPMQDQKVPVTLTDIGPETEYIQTGYDPEPITYLAWCKLEVERLRKDGRSVELWQSGHGSCAVAYTSV